MNETRSLRAAAIIIGIIACLLIATSGLCAIIFAADSPKDTLGIFLFSAIGLVPGGLLAWAMWRHIKQGSNLASEIIAILFGLLTVVFGGLGLLFIGWGIWSIITRRKTPHE